MAKPSRAHNLNRAFIDKLALEGKKQGVLNDTYDATYLFGVMLEWLGTNNAALTPTGIRRFKRRR